MVYLSNDYEKFVLCFERENMIENDWIYDQNKEMAEELYGIEIDNEVEDATDEAVDYPYNSEEIRIDQKMFSLYQVCKWIDHGKLILRPEFQRNFVWNKNKQSLLIESLMLRIPIPAFYFDEDETGCRTVIDGMQRLTTIHRYLRGEFRLRGLQYLKECEDKTFEELDWKYHSRIEDTQLAVNILDARCPEMVKFDVFRRINTGGVALNAQEVRNIMAKKQTRRLLQRMVDSQAFQKATHRKVNDARMGAQELCLRFITFYQSYDVNTGDFREFYDMTHLMDQMMLRLNRMHIDEMEMLYEKFEMSMEKCYALFGEWSFYKTDAKVAVNRALFTSFSVLLANEEKLGINWLYEQQNHAIHLLREMLNHNPDYYNAVTSSTSSRGHMITQFSGARLLLEELMA